MAFPTTLHEGMILDDRYRIIRRLGRGGMSQVYLAYDLKLPGKEWAIKETISVSSTYREAEAEAAMLITLSHPFLPRIVDVITSDDYTYMVMDYIRGETLEEKFRTQPEQIDVPFILRCGDQLLRVLEYLHQHEPPIIFRDLKPSNVMITPEGDVRLIDFGIARTFKPQESHDTVKLGTVGFAAPEQYGGGQTDHRADLYGLGALLLYLATGGMYSEWLHGMEELVRNDMPTAAVQMLQRLLQLDPAHRFQSASEARQALQIKSVQRSHVQDTSLTPLVQWNKTTQVIALIGATAGVGTTHAAIMVAHYLARRQHSVALVEMNGAPGAFARIQQVAVSGLNEQQRMRQARQFELENVHYWRESARAEVVSLLGGSYQFIVLDLGMYKHNDRLEEFLRADLPIVVGSGAEWRYQDMIELTNELKQYSHEKWHYCLPLAHEAAVRRLRKELATEQVYALPCQPDPFDEHEDTDILLAILLQRYLPLVHKKRKFRFGLQLF
ncbi:serine/threonine protein kinase [Paenibacillus sp. SGZ-1009]|uniref:serine/threonine protein kinase n=1 Tax=Paenibacillus campi TaxID=3106031 RepID=UPI002AFEC5C1|nr:protein kinase [Paenibacillus sp. SGZ-1009]